MKLICIVIASTGSPYDEYKKLWLSQIQKVNNIEFYFIYNNANIFFKNGNDLYFPFDENIKPGIYQKTIACYEWLIQNNIDFTHLLRANLSSFFVFDKLLDKLTHLPTSNMAFGKLNIFGNLKFPTGCGTVFTKDVIQKIIKYKNDCEYTEYNDDVAVGQILANIKVEYIDSNFVDLYYIPLNSIEAYINTQNHYHYRTKKSKLEGVDIFETLLNKFI